MNKSRGTLQLPTSGYFKNDVAIAKALGIILMVIGHAGCPYYFHDFIYMFHMPLFFFLTGYCFKPQYLSIPMTYVKRRVLGLYIPFVTIAILFLLLHNIFVKFNLIEEGYYTWLEIIDRSKSIIFSMHKEEPLIAGFWFIPQLFWASLISYVLLKYLDVKAALILTFVLVPLLYCLNIDVPYTAISYATFYASSFFLIGYWVAGHSINDQWYYVLLAVILVIIASVIMPTGMFCKKGAWQLLPYLVVAVSGCYFMMSFSRWLAKKDNSLTKILIYIGSSTMWVLTLHLICFKLLTLFIINLRSDDITNLRVTPIFHEYSINSGWILYSLVGVLVPIAICMVVRFIGKHLPYTLSEH